MAKLKRSYVAPYGNLPAEVRLRVDFINKLRGMRLKSAATMGLATRGIPARALEKTIIHETGKLGELIRRKELAQFIELPSPKTAHHEEITTTGLASTLTHAHVDRKGNIVFTKEARELVGKEIIPRALKPGTWRWRMKVPIRMEKARHATSGA